MKPKAPPKGKVERERHVVRRTSVGSSSKGSRPSKSVPSVAREEPQPAAADASVRWHGLEQLRAHLIPCDLLLEDPANVRRHGARNLEAIKSALSLGQHRPAVVQRRGHSLVVRVGNGMLRCARELGWTHLAGLIVDENDVQATARAIADNRAAELAEWDAPELARSLHALEVSGPELLAVAGFTADELKALDDLTRELPAPEPAEPKPDEPEPSEPPKVPVSRAGDLWRIGPHRLLVGDSTANADVDRLIAGEHVKLVVTDPPYAIFGSSSGVSSEVADDRMVRPFFDALFRMIERVLSVFHAAYVFTDWRSYAALWDGAGRTSIKVRNAIVWDKGGGLGSHYQNCYELIAYAIRAPKSHAIKANDAAGLPTVNKPNLIRASRPTGENRQHHAAKPVELLEQLIENSSSEGDLVLDLFAGSGSTALAAHAKQRRCALMEIEPARADVAVERLAKFTGTTATLEDGRTFEAVKAERVPK